MTFLRGSSSSQLALKFQSSKAIQVEALSQVCQGRSSIGSTVWGHFRGPGNRVSGPWDHPALRALHPTLSSSQIVVAVPNEERPPGPPNVALLRALWSLLDCIWGLLKGSWDPFFGYLVLGSGS